MSNRAAPFILYFRYFFRYALYVREILVGHILLLLAGGLAISRIEGLQLGEAVYFAFITGLTIGYGDIAPATALGQIVSVVIGMTGLLFTGITVALATRALHSVVEQYQAED
jgi:voltage-gated potassium channel